MVRRSFPLLTLLVAVAVFPSVAIFGGHSRSTVPVQQEMLATQEKLAATQADLTSTTDQLAATKAELDSVKLALANALTQVGRRNPTYSQAIQFLKEDKTNLNKYDADSYNCRDFSADVIKNAEVLGIRAAYVSLRLQQGSHAVVGFETVDKGMVYFEPQTDKVVVLPVGQSYLLANGHVPAVSQDDTILRVTVIW